MEETAGASRFFRRRRQDFFEVADRQPRAMKTMALCQLCRAVHRRPTAPRFAAPFDDGQQFRPKRDTRGSAILGRNPAGMSDFVPVEPVPISIAAISDFRWPVSWPTPKIAQPIHSANSRASSPISASQKNPWRTLSASRVWDVGRAPRACPRFTAG